MFSNLFELLSRDLTSSEGNSRLTLLLQSLDLKIEVIWGNLGGEKPRLKKEKLLAG